MIQNNERIELMRRAKDALDSELIQLEEIYIILYAISKIVTKNVHAETIVPIKKLIADEEVEIYERKLSTIDDNFVNELLGTLEKVQDKWRIYINRDIGSLTKRYVMAHEFSHYIINSIEMWDVNENCTNVLLPPNTREQMCDIMSSFLILPFCTVVKLLREYIDDQKKLYGNPIDLDEWIHYLGNEMGLKEYHTILCYQNVRYLAGALYRYKEEKNEKIERILTDLNVDLEEEIQLIEKNPEFFRRR